MTSPVQPLHHSRSTPRQRGVLRVRTKRAARLAAVRLSCPKTISSVAETAAVNFTKLTEDDKVLAFVGLGGSHISTQLQPDIERSEPRRDRPPQTIDIQLEGDQYFNNLAHYGDQADIAPARSPPTSAASRMPSSWASASRFPRVRVRGLRRAVGHKRWRHLRRHAVRRSWRHRGHRPDGRAQAAIDDQGVNYVTLHGSPGAAWSSCRACPTPASPRSRSSASTASPPTRSGPKDPPTSPTRCSAVHSFLTANNETEAPPR